MTKGGDFRGNITGKKVLCDRKEMFEGKPTARRHTSGKKEEISEESLTERKRLLKERS